MAADTPQAQRPRPHRPPSPPDDTLPPAHTPQPVPLRSALRVSHRPSASMPNHDLSPLSPARPAPATDATPLSQPGSATATAAVQASPFLGFQLKNTPSSGGPLSAEDTPLNSGRQPVQLKSSALSRRITGTGSPAFQAPSANTSGRMSMGQVPPNGVAAPQQLAVRRTRGQTRSLSGDIYGTLGQGEPSEAGHPHASHSDNHHAGRRGGTGGSTNMRAAIPQRMVQDTATCIPLVRLFGRFSQSGGAKPVRMLGQGLKDAVQAVQAPLMKGMHKLKGAGKGLLNVTHLRQRHSGSEATKDSSSGAGARDAAYLAPPSPDHPDSRPRPYHEGQATAPGVAGLGAAASAGPLLGGAVDGTAGVPLPLFPGHDPAIAPIQDQLRTVYIQIKGVRGLIKPQVQGVAIEYATYCVINMGDTRKRTQVLRGSAAPQWNEVFGFTVAQLAPNPLVQLEVWDQDAWGRDFFIGQAELDLYSLLLCTTPAPVDVALPLIQRDPRTGQLEPGTYGQLAATAWLGSRAITAAPGGDGMAFPTTVAGDGDGLGEDGSLQDGFRVSSLLVKAGLPKGLPLVSHSPLGTLYEEPCISYVKLTVVALRDIDPQRLLQAAVTTNRIIKLAPRASQSLQGSTSTFRSFFATSSAMLLGSTSTRTASRDPSMALGKTMRRDNTRPRGSTIAPAPGLTGAGGAAAAGGGPGAGGGGGGGWVGCERVQGCCGGTPRLQEMAG